MQDLCRMRLIRAVDGVRRALSARLPPAVRRQRRTLLGGDDSYYDVSSAVEDELRDMCDLDIIRM